MMKKGKAGQRESTSTRFSIQLENDLLDEIDLFCARVAPGVTVPRTEIIKVLLRRGLESEKRRKSA